MFPLDSSIPPYFSEFHFAHFPHELQNHSNRFLLENFNYVEEIIRPRSRQYCSVDVYHPSSPNFGKHLYQEEVHSIFAPAKESIEVVKNWLFSSDLFNKNDIIEYENKGWLAVDMQAKHAERLFGTKYYEHELTNGDIKIGCDEYHLPTHISSHVDFIRPGVMLSAPLKKRQVEKRREIWAVGSSIMPTVEPSGNTPLAITAAVRGLLPSLQNCSLKVTPACIKAL